MDHDSIEELIKAEEGRQKTVVNLVASENYVSREVLRALGSVLTNKYAEGYPGERYYGGQVYIDQIEKMCQDRALKLFDLSSGEWSVNVQPLSGSPANLAVFLASVKPGGKIMGLSLSHGGHLTHGHKVSASGIFWRSATYEVDIQTGLLDYDAIAEQARIEKPQLIIAGFTAYSRLINWSRFRQIADDVGATLLVDMSHIAGLVAGRVFPSPFPFADVVTTTGHKTLRGPRGAMIFSRLDGDLTKKIDKAVFPGLQGGPHVNQIAATAVALAEADSPEFQSYAGQVVKNARALAGELGRLGWPIVTGGTDSHLFLLDTWRNGEGPTGKEASEKLEAEGVIVNKNTLPGDLRKPVDPSGIRLGTAAETTRGKKESDMTELAQKIDKILQDR